MDANADKMERFERLAEKRTDEIIKKIKLLGNLSNRNNYSYTDEHVKQIFSAIDKELKAAQSRFSLQATKSASGFRFNKT